MAPGNVNGPSRLFVAILLADVTCFGIVMPLLASYASEFGAGTAAIGGLVATYSLLHFLLAPLWGRFSDRVGRRPVLLIGLTGTLLSSVVFALADSFLLLLASRVLAGALGATLNVTQAYAADITPPERRTRMMGLIGATFGVGFILGPTIGGLASLLGNAAPGAAAAAIALVNLTVALARLREPAQHRTIEPRLQPSRATLLRYFPPFAAAFATTFAFTVIYVVFPLHAEQAMGLDRSRVSYLFALVGLVTAMVQGGAVGRLAPRLGEGRLVTLGGILMALGLAGLPAAASAGVHPALLLVSLALLGAGYGLAGPAETGYVSRTAAAADQGGVLGLLQSVNSVSRVLGPAAAGAVMAIGGAPLAFMAAASAAAVAGVVGTVMRRQGAVPPATSAG